MSPAFHPPYQLHQYYIRPVQQQMALPQVWIGNDLVSPSYRTRSTRSALTSIRWLWALYIKIKMASCRNGLSAMWSMVMMMMMILSTNYRPLHPDACGVDNFSLPNEVDPTILSLFWLCTSRLYTKWSEPEPFIVFSCSWYSTFADRNISYLLNAFIIFILHNLVINNVM